MKSRIGAPASRGWKIGSTTKTILPRNILLLRHARSMGNDDETLFTKIPDWKIPLSHEGRQQAREAGERIQKIIGSSRVFFYVSPYRRTNQTLDEIKRSIPARNVLFTREEPRLREQDFGNFQDYHLIQASKKEREGFGRFFYRFPHGESGADVFDRVSAFCGTFHRDIAQIEDPDATAVFVTHGITARLFVMRWLHWSVEDFEALHNPPNCGLLHLQRVGEGSNTAYRLTEDSRELIQAPTETGIGRGLQLGQVLSRKNERDRITWDQFPETAWGT